jgi:hypothetical protein
MCHSYLADLGRKELDFCVLADDQSSDEKVFLGFGTVVMGGSGPTDRVFPVKLRPDRAIISRQQ